VNFVYNGVNQIDCLDGNGNGAWGDTEVIPYTYYPCGNLTSDGMKTYSYDAANRLISVSDGLSMTTYTYSGDRISQMVDQTPLSRYPGLHRVCSGFAPGCLNHSIFGHGRPQVSL
jgi:hypothetical protein